MHVDVIIYRLAGGGSGDYVSREREWSPGRANLLNKLTLTRRRILVPAWNDRLREDVAGSRWWCVKFKET